MKRTIFLTIVLLLPLLAVPRARALELSLEENRGQSGTIGYVDIDKVFKEYSGSTGARKAFLSRIKKKEDELNKKKTAIFTLKAELAKLRQEREFAKTLPSLMAAQRSVEKAAQATEAEALALKKKQAELQAEAAEMRASTSAVAASTSAVAASTSAVQASTEAVAGPTSAVQASTAAVSVSTQAVRAASPAGTAKPPASVAHTTSVTVSSSTMQPPMQLSTQTAAALPGMASIDMPGVSKVPLADFKFSVSTSVADIDAAIAKEQAELDAKQKALDLAQKQDEKELLEYENHKSQLLLGRIYVALKELAVKEEVSVVVDKRDILYGQKAVDLTDKLIKKLKKGGI